MSCLHNRRHQRQAARAAAYYPLVPGYGAAPRAGLYYPAPGPYYGGNPEMTMRPVQGLGGARGMYPDQQYQNLQAEEHRHKQNQHRAEMGALGTAAFAAVSFIILTTDLQFFFSWTNSKNVPNSKNVSLSIRLLCLL